MPNTGKKVGENLKLTTMKKLFLSLKTDLAEITIWISGLETIYNEIKTANLGVTDEAEWVKNAATAIVKGEANLPKSWQGSNMLVAVTKFLVKLESGIPEAEVETIVKTVIASGVTK